MKIIHERDIPEISHPGRFMRWLANEQNLQPRKLSACVIRVLPGETVRPAHCHPLSEELIYIIQGAGNYHIDIRKFALIAVWIDYKLSVDPGHSNLGDGAVKWYI